MSCLPLQSSWVRLGSGSDRNRGASPLPCFEAACPMPLQEHLRKTELCWEPGGQRELKAPELP